MIRRLIKINLKGTTTKINILILAITSIIITYINLSIYNTENYKEVHITDILILAFGGLSKDFVITKNFQSFILWIFPNIIIIYLINIFVIHKFRKRSMLILPRVKKKLDWIISYNVTIWIIIIKYYLIFFGVSLITIVIMNGYKLFLHTNILTNNNIQINKYLIIFYLLLLNIGTMLCLVSFINNIYHLFFNSNHVSLVAMIICFISVCITKFSKINNFILMNQQMLIRHNLFKDGFKGFTLKFSVLYLFIFLFINFFINVLIIKQKDLIDI